MKVPAACSGILTTREYWDEFHIERDRRPFGHFGRDWGDRISMSRSGRLLYFWAKQLLPPGGTIVEIGSAPGENLLRLARYLRCEPYGIEYSPVGAEIQRKIFAAAGVNPDNVIEGDFFSNDMERCHKRYDIVASFGFVEHFGRPSSVIDRHIDLVKPGGYLMVSIPNFRGLNLVMAHIFNPKIVDTHNMVIMERSRFRKLFQRRGVQELFCDYVGSVNLALCMGAGGSRILKLCLLGCQKLINLEMSFLPLEMHLEHSLVSPTILFIGRCL